MHDVIDASDILNLSDDPSIPFNAVPLSDVLERRENAQPAIVVVVVDEVTPPAIFTRDAETLAGEVDSEVSVRLDNVSVPFEM